jgi:uncharacterized protein
MKAIIKDIIQESKYFEYPNLIRRKVNLPIGSNLIVSVIGPRRSGKTYLLYDTIVKLQKSGVPKENILFINFEDERLQVQSEQLDLILQSYTELYPEIDLKETYFFFDEIQNIKGWEKFIRRVYDTKNKNIFLTGSNARLLSSEIATALRGRTITYTLLPLSFSEYLDFNKIEKRIHPLKSKSTIINYLKQFIHNGGFPETLFVDKAIRIKLLQSYFNVMIFRDIVERYTISDIATLKYFIKKIFASVTIPFSINKTYNDIRSMGYKISNKYLYDYLDYCNNIFLCQVINKYDFSELKQAKSEKKVYVIDTGLLASIEFSVSENIGKLFENLVFLEFLKAEYEIFYYKNKYECDFIVRKNQILTPVQVCYDIGNKDTFKRECRGLAEACEYLKISNGIIISFDETLDFKYNDIDIQVVPFYTYFLNQ